MEQNRLRIVVEDLKEAIYEVADHYELNALELAGLLLGQVTHLFDDKEDAAHLFRHAAQIASIQAQLRQEKPDGTIH